ncbi:MAG: BatA domain-containing protein, partial [Planctomycetota bacterium]
MFLYPALTIGFLFVAVPLLVHLINMLRHRRQRWAAMDFLLASYRKQKKWIVMRQLLLLLSRLALATLLIALLSGWSGGRQLLSVLGGTTTHHVVVLDDSYSMGDRSGGSTSYQVALQTVSDLTRRLSNQDGDHQLTVLRASRAALAVRTGNANGDAAADLSAQTIDSDTSVINRVMATEVSPIRTDLIPAIELASELVDATDSDEKYCYLVSDFRQRDWDQAERISERLAEMDRDVEVRLLDCAASPTGNLAITTLSPRPDVWVAGVPTMIDVRVKNFGADRVTNVPISVRLVLYEDDGLIADPGQPQSGRIDAMPALMIESIDPGEEITKSFQVFIGKSGTHAVEAKLPDDALIADNTRTCTLPLSPTESVLVIDDDPDGRGSYHVESVLNPGSQVRIGAVPERQSSSFLRSITPELLSKYRAVYLIDVPSIGENSAAALETYVRRGGGLAWFLGDSVDPNSYNQTLVSGERFLLPSELVSIQPLEANRNSRVGDLMLGDETELLQPLRSVGDSVFGLVGLSDSWTFSPFDADANGDSLQAPGIQSLDPKTAGSSNGSVTRPVIRVPVRRGDDLPLVTQHELGLGRVITVAVGLDGKWTNWQGDPTFVVFLLQANADLWSAASPETSRFVDQPIVQPIPSELYTDRIVWLPPTIDPPRLPIELNVQAGIIEPEESDEPGASFASTDFRAFQLRPAPDMDDQGVELDDL